MGFNLNKARAKKEEIIRSFTPIELNEGNVQSLFEKCLATESTAVYVESILYQKAFGYEEDSNPIYFDSEKLLNNLKYIRYLYGQLKTTHEHSNTISTSEQNTDRVMLNYKDEIWTENKGVLLQFFHLGVGSNTIFPFNLQGSSGFQNVGIKPTLSPNDPDFSQWWEEHKAQWE